MNKTINFLVTCTVFVLAVQSYAKSETTMAQTPTVDEEYTPPVDEGTADEFFNQGNEEMEQDSRDLESENNERLQNNEQQLKDEQIQRTNQLENNEQIQRNEQLENEEQRQRSNELETETEKLDLEKR